MARNQDHDYWSASHEEELFRHEIDSEWLNFSDALNTIMEQNALLNASRDSGDEMPTRSSRVARSIKTKKVTKKKTTARKVAAKNKKKKKEDAFKGIRDTFKEKVYFVTENNRDDDCHSVHLLSPVTTSIAVAVDILLNGIMNRIGRIYDELCDCMSSQAGLPFMGRVIDDLNKKRFRLKELIPSNVLYDPYKWTTELFDSIFESYFESLPGYNDLTRIDKAFLEGIHICIAHAFKGQGFKLGSILILVKETEFDTDDDLYEDNFELIDSPLIYKFNDRYFTSRAVEFPDFTASRNDVDKLDPSFDLLHTD